MKVIKEHLSEIITLSYQVNKETKHTIFARFSGHINQLTIDVHINGWVKDSSANSSRALYTDEFYEKESADSIIKYLKNLLKETK